MSKKRIDELKSILNHHNIQYYVNDDPAISDAEYDSLLKELENLENQYPGLVSFDSPTQRVGGVAIDAFESITHKIPMLSLANAMNENELENYLIKNSKDIKKYKKNSKEFNNILQHNIGLQCRSFII